MYDMPVAIFQTATRVEAVYPESFFCVWRVDTDPVTGSVPDIGDSLTFGLWQLANGRIPAPGDLSVLNRALSAYHQRHGAAGYEGRCSVEIPDEHDVLCGSPLASPGDGKDAAKTPGTRVHTGSVSPAYSAVVCVCIADHPPDSPPAMSRKRRREGEGEDDGYHSGSVAGLSEGPVSPRLKRAKACGGSTFAALCRSIADHGVFDLDDTDVPSFATSYTSDASRRPVGL